jgi:hypothetical protein
LSKVCFEAVPTSFMMLPVDGAGKELLRHSDAVRERGESQYRVEKRDILAYALSAVGFPMREHTSVPSRARAPP